MSVLGEHEAVGLALEQLDGEVLLQLGNAPADRRMINFEPPRRRHQPPLAGELEKEHEVVPVEHGTRGTERHPGPRRFPPLGPDERTDMMPETAGAREAGTPARMAVVFPQPDLRVCALGSGKAAPVP